MTDVEHEHDIRIRSIGTIVPEDGDVAVTVDHVYLPDGAAGSCDHCGGPCHDPGIVGLGICDLDEDGEHKHAQLTAEEALALANRLTRAANLVLEAEEDGPDLDREAIKYRTPKEPGGGGENG